MNNCSLCGFQEETLYNGLCAECLNWLWEQHKNEVTEWYLIEVVEQDDSYDLTEKGCREFCLSDDPYYFSQYIVLKHPEWLAQAKKKIRENTWRWLDALDRFR